MQLRKRKIGKRKLFGFLEVVDKELSMPIDLTAVGGTAMTLLGLKPSTIDMDFDSRSDKDGEEFRKALDRVPHGFKVDRFTGGFIFSQQLPKDYFEKSIVIPHNFKNIRLRALHPLDIVLSKTGRLIERDMQDIEFCIKKCKIRKSQIKKRAKLVEYVGHEESYQTNLRYVVNNFFNKVSGKSHTL